MSQTVVADRGDSIIDSAATAMTSALKSIPPKSRGLASIGDKTLEAVSRIYQRGQLPLLPAEEGVDLSLLSEALISTSWSDDEAAKLIASFHELYMRGRAPDIKSLAKWSRFHVNDAESVAECMVVEPPEEIEITRILSRKGSQKVVFLATWRLTLQEIVLKRIIAQGETAERILSRELHPHPLSMVHPNIIETHFLRNRAGERFLVERRLSEVLSDAWMSQGIHEAANLLFDITKALKFLHDHQLGHGDVKPDNIGKKGATYVLLDFGLCRDLADFNGESTPTGSLRTRCPELLIGAKEIDADRVDVWALGATVYKSVTGRFPLVGADERVPRISTPQERAKFEAVLSQRVKNEWDEWVDYKGVPSPLRDVLGRMLEKDPRNRISAIKLLEKTETELSAFLRSTSQFGDSSGRFSPFDEVLQIQNYLDSFRRDVTLIPRHKKQAVLARVKELQMTQGFTQDQKETLAGLVSTLA